LQNVQPFIGQTISIVDIEGKEVYHEIFKGQLVSTKDIGLTKGMYILKLTNEKTQETTVGKLLVE